MKLKWRMFWAIIVLYTFGMIGIGWQTYAATKALSATQPQLVPALETVKMIFIMLGGMGVILPAYLNVYTALENQKNADERLRFDRIENTYSLLERWDAPALLEARKYTRELKCKHKDLSANQLIDEIEKNPSLKQSVILVLNYFEAVRVSVDNDRVDAKVVADSMLIIFDDIFDRFKPYITEKMNANIFSDLMVLKKLLERARQM